MPAYTIRLADWSTDGPHLRRVRREIFIVEQQVPESLELDGLDPECRHALAEEAESGDVLGVARLTPDLHIGRVAVLKAYRKRGIGTALTKFLIARAAEEGFPRVIIHSQTHAVEFYARLGFSPEGKEFMEAGIPHIRMVRELMTPD